MGNRGGTFDQRPGTTDLKNKKYFWSIVLGPLSLVLFFCCLFGCSTSFDTRGAFHKVRSGESLLWVAKSYGVDLQDLAEMNNIQNLDQALTPGERLYIPERRVSSFKKLPFEGTISENLEKPVEKRKGKKFKEPKAANESIFTDHNRFEWPVKGEVMSPFGIRHGRRHDGIDIKAVKGTRILAADKGLVVFSGSMRGYGNLILIRHKDNFFTAYAHNRLNSVKEGQKVKKGQVIGEVGRTGRATGAHLHFEVREGEKARNPLFFLPAIN